MGIDFFVYIIVYLHNIENGWQMFWFWKNPYHSIRQIHCISNKFPYCRFLIFSRVFLKERSCTTFMFFTRISHRPIFFVINIDFYCLLNTHLLTPENPNRFFLSLARQFNYNGSSSIILADICSLTRLFTSRWFSVPSLIQQMISNI